MDKDVELEMNNFYIAVPVNLACRYRYGMEIPVFGHKLWNRFHQTSQRYSIQQSCYFRRIYILI